MIEFLEGNGLAQYREMFVVNQIDQDELVKLTDVDLQEMGMSTASNRQRLLEQLRYISKARNACSKVATPRSPPSCVWVGKHQGMDQKADRLLQNASGVLIHGYLMYLLAGSSKGWQLFGGDYCDAERCQGMFCFAVSAFGVDCIFEQCRLHTDRVSGTRGGGEQERTRG